MQVTEALHNTIPQTTTPEMQQECERMVKINSDVPVIVIEYYRRDVLERAERIYPLPPSLRSSQHNELCIKPAHSYYVVIGSTIYRIVGEELVETSNLPFVVKSLLSRLLLTLFSG